MTEGIFTSSFDPDWLTQPKCLRHGDMCVGGGSGPVIDPAAACRRDTIARAEREGWMVPGCLGCGSKYAAEDPLKVFGPPHKASTNCESGARPHCTCDVCF